eukprot:532136-Ditylum_brightwellii.AAC.1
MSYGLEFCLATVLERVFSTHPNWERLKTLLEKGSEWPLETLSEENRAEVVKAALNFENHKGSSEKPEFLKKFTAKDVHYGYSLPGSSNPLPRHQAKH